MASTTTWRPDDREATSGDHRYDTDEPGEAIEAGAGAVPPSPAEAPVLDADEQHPRGLVDGFAHLLGDGIERALDALVADVARHPLPVHSAEDAVDLLIRNGTEASFGFPGAVLGWIGGRWGARLLRVGRRFSLPMRTVLTLVPPLASAVRRGLFELRVLASLAANRLVDEGCPVDTRHVQRLTVNAYLWPDRPVAFAEMRPDAIPRLAWVWATHAVSSDYDRTRVERAATALEHTRLGCA